MKPTLTTGLILLALAFLGGMATCRASLDPPDTTLADSLAATKRDFQTYIDATQGAVDRAVREAVTLDSLAAAEALRARQAQARATRNGARADSLARMLLVAGTPSDSLPLLVSQVAEFKASRDEWRASSDGFEAAWTRQKAASDSLGRAVTTERGVSAALQTRLAAQERATAELIRQVRGCRVPIVGAGCPSLGVDYMPSEGAVLAGVDVPLKKWLRVGVRWQVR